MVLNPNNDEAAGLYTQMGSITLSILMLVQGAEITFIMYQRYAYL
jgi:hypothetical protein